MRFIQGWVHDRRGDMAEAAVTLPVVLLATFAMINLALAGFASVNAANAANYGARIGSVSQENPAAVAASAANQMISNAPIGKYTVSSSGGGEPGVLLAVRVDWSVTNFFRGLLHFFGADVANFSGTSVAYFRQEGW